MRPRILEDLHEAIAEALMEIEGYFLVPVKLTLVARVISDKDASVYITNDDDIEAVVSAMRRLRAEEFQKTDRAARPPADVKVTVMGPRSTLSIKCEHCQAVEIYFIGEDMRIPNCRKCGEKLAGGPAT